MKVSPSILSVLDNDLDKIINQLERANVKYLHLDVMDNIFVPNYTFDETLVKKIKDKTNMILDTHLMIEDPLKEIDNYIKTNSDYLCFHIEATNHPFAVIEKIKKASLKAGIAIKPNTPLEDIMPYLPYLDLVLVMSVEPGFGGQKFIEEVLVKTQELSKLKKMYAYPYLIEMDGGIDNEIAKKVKKAGCDMIVVGTYLFKQNDIFKTIKELEEI